MFLFNSAQQDEEQLAKWDREQELLHGQLIVVDDVDWQMEPDFAGLQYIVGFDISFLKDDETLACASLVVLNFPQLEVVHSICELITLRAAYIPGYLAFREAPPLIDLFERLKQERPDIEPQVVFVDGNGVLHPKGFGLACHVGVLLGLPTIGVAKKLFQVDGLANDDQHKRKIDNLYDSSDCFPLIGQSGSMLGVALRSTAKTRNPIYVSIGHKFCLPTAVRLVRACCIHRVPEPVRQADILSREFLRERFPETLPPPRRTYNRTVTMIARTFLLIIVGSWLLMIGLSIMSGLGRFSNLFPFLSEEE